jgi:hypothetical protein
VASRCIFDASLARHLELDLKSGILERTRGIGGSANGWVHQVCLYVPGGDPVTIHASFQEDLSIAGLLGMNGFFEHFTVTFNHLELCCEIKRIMPEQE